MKLELNVLETDKVEPNLKLGLIYSPFLRNNLNETQVNTKNGRRTTVNKENAVTNRQNISLSKEENEINN